MVLKKRFFEYFLALSAILFIVLTVVSPQVCGEGAKKGLIICANAIIPALFPFAVPVLFLTNTQMFAMIKRKRLAVFLLSLIGGYPIGARLIFELYNNNELDKHEAQKILPFFVNAGPAFIVIAVGKGILNSITIGYILLISHTLSSIIMSLVFIPKYILYKSKNTPNKKEICVSDNFVLSVNGGSGACISICAFVILFSVVNEYVFSLSLHFKPLAFLIFFTEVTSAVSRTENIYLISFLLGFAGVSIWMQILSMSKSIKPPILPFISARVLHGVLSTVITAVIIKLSNITVYAVSNNIKAYEKNVHSNVAVSISLLIMSIMLLMSITAKKHSGNILEDVL